MSSPVISLLFPILFFIFPFIILKIRGIPITFSVYLEVLQDIAKHHFIGKIMTNISSISPDKLIYLALMVGLYFYQIYQNIQLCIKFYKSIHKINEYLFEMREYLGQSIERMGQFVEKHRSKNTYSQFCKVTEHHINTLSMFYTELEPIKPLTQFVFKLGSIGYLLKCYYELHSNIEYDKSIRYSFGFEGYLDNLRGIADHLNSGTINIAKYNRTKSCKFQDEYYPAYFKDAPVKNTCKLNKNIIITGPNASGKTTLLKTTTINIIFVQQIGCGFFKSCTLNPYTHIHSYLNIPDTSERDSLFQAESRRCKEIIDVINKNPLETKSRHFCIFDELYSGTNPSEATKSAYAFLNYLTKYSNVDFILTTHYASLCKKLKTNKQIRNYMMNVLQKEDGKLEYEYKLKSGISKVQGAIRILEDMNYPKEIIDEIKKI
jgi:energy-coupling factor transporter ATP-binding protein EcfA2